MPDKGIQIIIALLEKRESYIITKDSDPGMVRELLRAERSGYVQKEVKSNKYTLSEKGRRWVYSGYFQEAHDATPMPLEPATTAGTVTEKRIKFPIADIRENGRLPGIHASGLLLALLLLCIALYKWVAHLLA